ASATTSPSTPSTPTPENSPPPPEPQTRTARGYLQTNGPTPRLASPAQRQQRSNAAVGEPGPTTATVQRRRGNNRNGPTLSSENGPNSSDGPTLRFGTPAAGRDTGSGPETPAAGREVRFGSRH